MAVAAIVVLSRAFDIPKSPIFMTLSLVRKMLAVFRSLWMIRLHNIRLYFPWTSCIPRHICTNMVSTVC